MGVVSGVNTVTDGLIFYVDPTNANTYSGVGTTAYNLIPGGINNFSLNNGLAYDLDKSGSFYFDGSNDYVGLGSTTIFNSTAFTVSFWIKPTAYNGTVCSGAVSNGQYTIFGTSSTYQGYSSTFSGAIQTGGSSNSVATVNQSNFSINKWYHYVAVYDSAGTGNSTKFKIYIDGAIKSLTFDASMPSSPYAANQESRLGFGPGAPGYPYYNGNIGLVQIHSRALSSTEILQNYNATKARFNTTENIVTDNLILYVDPGKASSYPGTGTSVYDLSSTGNIGTLTNGPTFSSTSGGILVFDGTNDYLRMPYKSVYNRTNGSFAIEAYLFFKRAITDERMIMEYDNWGAAGVYQLTFATTNMFRINFTQAWAASTQLDYTIPVLPLNKWMHVVGQFDNNTNTSRLYLDGVLTAQRTDVTQEIGSSVNDLFICCRNGTGLFLSANLGYIKLYDKALTTTEVLQNYNATKNRFINTLPAVSDSSLVLNLDAGNRASYAGTGTTWTDLSSNGLRASLINGPVFAGTGISTYFSFDGSNDYVSIPTTLSVNASAFSFEVVFRITTGADGNTLLSLNYTAPNAGYLVRQTTGNYLIIYSDNGTETSISSTAALSNNTTYHIVVVQSSNSCSIYINGILDKTASLSNPVLTISNENFLGRRGAPSYGAQLTGNIYLSKLYNRVLSASEVLQNFNSVRSRYNI